MWCFGLAKKKLEMEISIVTTVDTTANSLVNGHWLWKFNCVMNLFCYASVCHICLQLFTTTCVCLDAELIRRAVLMFTLSPIFTCLFLDLNIISALCAWHAAKVSDRYMGLVIKLPNVWYQHLVLKPFTSTLGVIDVLVEFVIPCQSMLTNIYVGYVFVWSHMHTNLTYFKD